ncbi:MAG: class I SAM-dependent methyltransferase [Deltaproteobacteria bacterium]|nr:class I SAM-dependent methyltransferase [Deltaproteobacteria bacterium]
MSEKPKSPKQGAEAGILPSSPEFWREYAQTLCRSPETGRALDGRFWDKAAATYDDLEFCHDYMHQVETVVSTLLEKGAIRPDHRVLDIACGTGTYSVRMAPHCQKVVGLDISKDMLEKLEEKKRLLKLRNIQTVRADWHKYYTDQKFDLVFVSMTPLLRSMDNIDRMLETSKKFLAIVSWAGVKENALFNSLFKELMGSSPYHHRSDIIVPFNYLYAKGLAPDLSFFNGCWKRTRSVTKQADSLIWQLELQRSLKSDEKEYVKKKVESLAKDGIITVKTRTRTGFMLVDKEAVKTPCCSFILLCRTPRVYVQ